MKLAAIYIVWDDWELLYHSIKQLRPYVDEVIVVYSEKSNSGEYSEAVLMDGIHYMESEPFEDAPARTNETRKRNLGLNKAHTLDCTHFIMLDADEFYEPFDKTKFDGNFVCGTRLYFKHPTLFIEDHTRVPFIHKLTPSIRFQKNYHYPFSATEDGPAIDPTRTMNITEGVEWSPVIMHHMSYVRDDINKKLRNSAGERVRQFSHQLLEDYRHAKPGYRSKFFRKTLQESPNLFGLPEMVDLSLSYPSVANDR